MFAQLLNDGFHTDIQMLFPGLAKTKLQGFPGFKNPFFQDFPGIVPVKTLVACGQMAASFCKYEYQRIFN